MVAIGNALGQGTPNLTQETVVALDQSIIASDVNLVRAAERPHPYGRSNQPRRLRRSAR